MVVGSSPVIVIFSSFNLYQSIKWVNYEGNEIFRSHSEARICVFEFFTCIQCCSKEKNR